MFYLITPDCRVIEVRRTQLSNTRSKGIKRAIQKIKEGESINGKIQTHI